jgi:hypothetical protein
MGLGVRGGFTGPLNTAIAVLALVRFEPWSSRLASLGALRSYYLSARSPLYLRFLTYYPVNYSDRSLRVSIGSGFCRFSLTRRSASAGRNVVIRHDDGLWYGCGYFTEPSKDYGLPVAARLNMSKVSQALLRLPLSLSPTRLCEEQKSLLIICLRKAAAVADGYRHPASVSEHDSRL